VAPARRPARTLLRAAALGAVAAMAAAAVALAAASEPITTRDARGDARTTLDLQRVSLALGADRRLRASLTMAAGFSTRDLRAASGPPGSICLRFWTRAGADPAAEAPDRLVCVTATPAGRVRASVLAQTDGELPRRVGSASVSRPSSRSIVVRVSQTALGRPERVRFSAETTRAGCARTSCIDTAPDAPSTRAFRLR
jgi:hypothetical protein